MPVKVLVCDDDAAFVQRMVKLIQAQPVKGGVGVQVVAVHDPATISDQLLAEFDVMFLDVDMGSYSGIAIAQRVRALELDAVLVFVTNYVEYSLVGYEVKAFRYLLKQDLEEKFPAYYQEALAEVQRKTGTFSFLIGREKYQVKYNSILYLESRQRTIYLHLLPPDKSQDYFYATMEEMEQKLRSAGFLRVHKSFLVNMKYIEKLKYDKVLLHGGESLPVSQRRFSELKIRYLQWRAEQ